MFRRVGVNSRRNLRNLEYTVALVIIFILYVVYNDDPTGFGQLFVEATAYILCLILSLAGLGYVKGRGRLAYASLIVVVTAAVLLSSYLLTSGNGMPVQGNFVSSTCTNVQIPNATSPSGFVYGSKCASSPFYNPTSILYNTVFWTPIVGSLIFAMPALFDQAKRNIVSSISRNLKGSVPAGTLLFLTFGLVGSSGYPQLFGGHSPLNPFIAYNYCDSATFGIVSCVQTSAFAYLIDLLFWIAVSSLITLIATELYDWAKSVIYNRVKSDTNVPETR